MILKDTINAIQKDFPFDGYMMDKYHKYNLVADTVFKYLKKGDKLFDFGSGPCDSTAVLQKMGINCWACDDLEDPWIIEKNAKEKIVSFAESMGINFALLNNEKLPFVSENFFDMVMMIDVLEHLHDSPREIINFLFKQLKPGGHCFFVVPNVVNIKKRLFVLFGKTNLPDYNSFFWHTGRWRGHVREYSKGDLKLLSKFSNLEIVELKSVDLMTVKVPGIIKPLYLLITYFFKGWKDTWLLVARKPG